MDIDSNPTTDQMLLLGYHMLGLGLVAASVRGVVSNAPKIH